MEKGKPQTARLICDDCGHHLTERERLAAIENPFEWPTDKREPRTGIRSFHATELVEQVFVARPASPRKARKPTRRKSAASSSIRFWRIPNDDGGEIKVDATELQQRAEPIKSPYAPRSNSLRWLRRSGGTPGNQFLSATPNRKTTAARGF